MISYTFTFNFLSFLHGAHFHMTHFDIMDPLKILCSEANDITQSEWQVKFTLLLLEPWNNFSC